LIDSISFSDSAAKNNIKNAPPKSTESKIEISQISGDTDGDENEGNKIICIII